MQASYKLLHIVCHPESALTLYTRHGISITLFPSLQLWRPLTECHLQVPLGPSSARYSTTALCRHFGGNHNRCFAGPPFFPFSPARRRTSHTNRASGNRKPTSRETRLEGKKEATVFVVSPAFGPSHSNLNIVPLLSQTPQIASSLASRRCIVVAPDPLTERHRDSIPRSPASSFDEIRSHFVVRAHATGQL